MKRLTIPENKLLKLLTNIFLVLGSNLFCSAILEKPIDDFVFNFVQSYGIGDWNFYLNLSDWIYRFIGIIPVIVITRFIWFGRIFPGPRITRSKD